MHFEFGFYSSLLLIFFVHGLVYAILLYRKGYRNDSQSDKWLSIFLLLCILYISPWMLGFGGWYDTQPYRDFLFYMPFQHLYFIGPIIFFYVQSLLNPSFRFGKNGLFHLLPGILYLLYSLIMFITDNLILHRYYFLADGADRDFDNWYQISGTISMLVYFLLSLRYYQLYRSMVVQVVSFADTLLFKWVKNFLTAFLIMILLNVVFSIASYFPIFANMQYTGPWWQYFSFALIFYYIAIAGYSNEVRARLSFRVNLLTDRPMYLLQPSALSEIAIEMEDAEIIEITTNKEDEIASDTLLDEWKPIILQQVAAEKAYEDPELTLTQLARMLKSNATIVSKVINQGFQLNFNDFINHHRVEAVKQKLQAGEQQNQTLLGIALDCGFNSKATFNRAFKKHTGLSPKEYMHQL